jgi:hypothetical protein
MLGSEMTNIENSGCKRPQFFGRVYGNKKNEETQNWTVTDWRVGLKSSYFFED